MSLYFIKSELDGRVLDVQEGSYENGAQIVVYHQNKSNDCSNQLWRFENGYLINVNSSKVVDIKDKNIQSGTSIIQYDQKSIEEADNQRWGIDDEGYIYCEANPNLVLDIKNCGYDDDPVILYSRRRTNAAANQRWYLEPLTVQ